MEESTKTYTLNDFIPLMVIAAVITGLSLANQVVSGWSLNGFMNDFMAFFFLIFGAFKMYNLKAFAQAYKLYDLIAGRVYAYGFVYPFIEVGLGLAYLMRWNPLLTNWVTLVVMLVSAAGVVNALSKKQTIMCACLGTVFKLPMTYVSLFEDLLMAAMAAWMLLNLY